MHDRPGLQRGRGAKPRKTPQHPVSIHHQNQLQRGRGAKPRKTLIAPAGTCCCPCFNEAGARSPGRREMEERGQAPIITLQRGRGAKPRKTLPDRPDAGARRCASTRPGREAPEDAPSWYWELQEQMASTRPGREAPEDAMIYPSHMLNVVASTRPGREAPEDVMNLPGGRKVE